MLWPSVIGAFALIAASALTGWVTLRVTRAQIRKEDEGREIGRVELLFDQSQELAAEWKRAYESSLSEVKRLEEEFTTTVRGIERELEMWRTAAHEAYLRPESDWWPSTEPRPGREG